MNLLQRFQDSVRDQNLFYPKDDLVLAVSGGMDSVVLCELCKQAGYQFRIAHCNFQLRGQESERDEQFVQNLGARYGIDVLTKRFDTEKYSRENKIGIQEAARDLRYQWFQEIVSGAEIKTSSKSGSGRASVLVTAHHRDDSIETLLMNFLRGTGLRGLEGIPAANNYIRRPLLIFWKDELAAFARENSIDFVEDSSNQTNKYTRNLLRHEIMPILARAYPEVKSNLVDNIHRFREISTLYYKSVAEIKKKLYRNNNGETHIPIKKLLSFHNKALIFEIISEYGFGEKQVEELVKLGESDSGKFIISPDGKWRIIKYRAWFVIAPTASEKHEMVILEEGKDVATVQNIKIKIQSQLYGPDVNIPTSSSIACLDAKGIRYPLILRKWKQGDYFYPLGMKKKKKLSRFFIDQRLSKVEREKIWVVESDKKIIWVVGLRIDDRFKITGKTKSLLKFSLEAS